MYASIRLFTFSAIFACCGIATAQVVGANAGSRDDHAKMPFLDLSDVAKANLHTKIPASEVARASRNDYRDPPIFNQQDPLSSGATTFNHHFDFNVDPEPQELHESELIAIGEVTSAETRLSTGGGNVYTVFDFEVRSCLKGNASGVVHLERRGGLVLLPTGKKKFFGVANWSLPLPGYKYVLFLKRISPPGDYTILGGYALNPKGVISLNQESHSSNGLSEAELIEQIRSEVKSM